MGAASAKNSPGSSPESPNRSGLASIARPMPGGANWTAKTTLSNENRRLGAGVMGGLWFPLPHWIPLILWVSPAVATLGMSVIVLISSRVSTFTEAQQPSALLVLPIILLVIGQAVGVIYLSIGLVVVLGAVIWLLDAGLIWLGIRQFSRRIHLHFILASPDSAILTAHECAKH